MKGEPIEMFDNLAVLASGKVAIATLAAPGITTIAPDGSYSKVETTDPFTTNICFGGPDMRDAYVTLSGTGKLAKAKWPEPGFKLNFNA